MKILTVDEPLQTPHPGNYPKQYVEHGNEYGNIYRATLEG